MAYRVVSEAEFHQTVDAKLREVFNNPNFVSPLPGCVTGPGRSGAIAAVYVSHKLNVPFIPYGAPIPEKLQPVLIVDTATWTGRTIRKAARKYGSAPFLAFYKETPGNMVKFWYEGRVSNVQRRSA
jgi:hypothetical protein